MNKIRTALEKVAGQSKYSKMLLFGAAVFLFCLTILATTVVVYRLTDHAKAISCDECGGGVTGEGGVKTSSGGSATASPATGGTSTPPSSNGMSVTFNRSCDSSSGGVCVFVMTPGQELIVHETLSNYSVNFSNAPGWPISGLTDYDSTQSPYGYLFNIEYEAGADFSCKPVPGTSQFPSIYSPEESGNEGCMHDFRGTNVPTTSSVDYYLRNNNSQPGDYHFQLINIKGVDTWGADFFSFIVRIPTPATPSYNFSCDTVFQQKDPGQTATYTLRGTSVNGFSGQVNVTVAGLPAGATAGAATINVPANSFGTTPLAITTDPMTPAGTYNLTFTGSSPGYSDQSCPAQLVINNVGQGVGPSVGLTASTPSVTSATQQFSLTWTPNNATSCDASAANPPPSGTPVNNPGWINGSSKDPSNGSHTQSGLTISTTTVFSIHCHKAGFPDADKDVTVAFNPTYAFSVTPNSMNFVAVQGAASPPAQTFTVTNNSTVSLTFSVSSNKTWLNLAPSSLTIAPNDSATVSAQPNITGSLSPNPDTASVTFDSNSPAGSQARPVTYTLNSAAGFTLDCTNINPNTSQTVIRGNTASWTVPVTGNNGFNQMVALTVTANYPTNSTPVGASLAFVGSPNPESHSGSVQLQTGATTQTGVFSNIIVTASSPGYPSQQCTLPPLIVDAYSFDVSPNTLSFSAQKDGPLPAAKIFLVTNNSTANITVYISKNTASTWYTMNGSSAQVLGPIVVAANGGTYTISVQPNTTGTTGAFDDPYFVVNAGAEAGTQIKDVYYEVTAPAPPVVSVTAECGGSIGAWTSPVSYTSGPNPSCSLASSGASGYIRWTSSPSTNSCSVTPLSGDTMQGTTSAANPVNPVATNSLNNPPAAHQFRVRCSPDGGATFKDDTVTFNVPAGGSYDLGLSTKHVVAVNGSPINNANPCNGKGEVVDPTQSFKEGDVVTFAINICNTGTADLTFNGSGDNSHAIVLDDVLGNLAKPASGWNASVSCGTDCQLAAPVESAGKVIFSIQAKPGSATNRLVSAGGVWTLYFNAVIRAQTSSTQPYLYFNNCILDAGGVDAMTVNNSPTAPRVYHNITGSTFDVPGFCLQALFSRSGSSPDRHEISP